MSAFRASSSQILLYFWCLSSFMLQLPQTNPGYNNTPFKFTKYSNAYMLVYIRVSDKDKIICDVDEKDIAEHLRVILVFFAHLQLIKVLFFSCSNLNIKCTP